MVRLSTLVSFRRRWPFRLSGETDVSFGGRGGADWWGAFAAAGGYGYQNTAIGQIIVLAYLYAYRKLVMQLGGTQPYLPSPNHH